MSICPNYSRTPMRKAGFDGDAEGRKVAAMRNSSLQGGYFILAARALGLDTGPMSGFDNAAVDAEFFADQPNVKSNFISTLGYGDPETIFGTQPTPRFRQSSTKSYKAPRVPTTLAIDCVGTGCSVALFDDRAVLAHEHLDIGRGHAERLVPLIATLPDKGRADCIAVNVGPGSFTGVRIGLSVARALGLAWGAEVLGYSALDLTAAVARNGWRGRPSLRRFARRARRVFYTELRQRWLGGGLFRLIAAP